MKKIILSTIGIAVIALFTGSVVFAQGMMGFPSSSFDNATIQSQQQEEQEGKQFLDNLNNKTVTCSQLKAADFEKIGEYFMSQSIGDTSRHLAMNAMMKSMMGEQGEEQLHIAWGKRGSGCDASATLQSQGVGFVSTILWWVLIIAGIVALIKWFMNRSRGTHDHEKPVGKEGFSQLILVLIVGAVVVIAGGGFWYYQQSAKQNKSASGTQAIPGASSGETSSTPGEQTNQNAVPKTAGQTNIPIEQAPAQTGAAPSSPSTPNISCTSPADVAHIDIFDSHVHMSSTVDAPRMISEMNKAGVSVANLYADVSHTLEAIAQYPGRFITFVDTPEPPNPSAWLTQGQAFITSTESQLKTGKFYGIGETNLRLSDKNGNVSTPDVYVVPDTPLWLQLVDLSARYHVPISFHFVPEDAVANAAFERMLGHNKDATLIWAHLGFNSMALDSAALNDYLLRYPHLYFDTAGIQNMQKPLPLDGSNWARLADQSNNGKLKAEWKKFFETWNSRILFGTDAGGGGDSLERWLNYSSDTAEGTAPDAVGHWKSLLSYLDSNSARNILNSNARELFLKKQKPVYSYSVASNGKCYSISVNSESSVSALTFNLSTRAVTFTVAGSNGTTGNAVITIPTALVGKNFTASVDGQSVKSQLNSNSTSTTISLQYTGGIRLITLSAPSTL